MHLMLSVLLRVLVWKNEYGFSSDSSAALYEATDKFKVHYITR